MEQTPPVVYIPPTVNQCNGNNLPPDISGRLQDIVEKRNRGAVSTFTEHKAIELVESIAEGSTIQAACDKIGISRKTFYVWRELIPDFLHMVQAAQELQADSMVDDNVINLQSVNCSSDADPRLVMAQLRKAEQVARFKFDLAKCLNFSKYGDKRHHVNTNINVDVAPCDLSRWSNR